MKKTGLILGKFAPLHKGHQFMIETALKEMDELIVLIYDTDLFEIPLHIRSGWIKKLYPGATVVEAWDGPQEVGDTPEIKKLNEDYILQRLQGIKITHFYSNEFYGEHVSQALGAENRQIDRSRDTFPISATMIREDAYKHKEYIDPVVYSGLITRVVFVGAMSTGKTTICEELAKRYNTVWMPEYGREYWEKHHVNRRVTEEQMVEIGRGHIEREDKLVYDANRYLFVDTNAITTYMFGMDYQGYVLPELETMALKAQSRYDIYFLCCDDIPYDDTWDRSGDQKRHIFQKQIIADLKERKLPYVELRGTLDERIAIVERVLKGFRKYDNPANLGMLARCDMAKKQIENSIAYCGLVCGLCRPDGGCNCKSDNHCGKRLSPQGCYQYDCCKAKGLNGCWECAEAPCGVDMLAPEKIKLRAFIRCIKEDGIDRFSEYITKNEENGIVYHRSGIIGDYDLSTEEAILNLLRNPLLTK